MSEDASKSLVWTQFHEHWWWFNSPFVSYSSASNGQVWHFCCLLIRNHHDEVSLALLISLDLQLGAGKTRLLPCKGWHKAKQSLNSIQQEQIDRAVKQALTDSMSSSQSILLPEHQGAEILAQARTLNLEEEAVFAPRPAHDVMIAAKERPGWSIHWGSTSNSWQQQYIWSTCAKTCRNPDTKVAAIEVSSTFLMLLS